MSATLLVASAVALFFGRHELALALGLLRAGDAAALALAAAAFVLVPLSAALTWRAALDRRLPLVGSCSRYGVGSLVNTFVPGRVGDGVRLVLFARLLEGMPRRSLALRFGGLELARVAVYVTLALAALDLRAAALATTVVLAVRSRLVLAVGCAAAMRVGAFAVALAALHVAHPLGSAVRIVPALEVAALLPISPGNALGASLATAAVLPLPPATGAATGLALHVLESAGGIAFGLASVAQLALANSSHQRHRAEAHVTVPGVEGGERLPKRSEGGHMQRWKLAAIAAIAALAAVVVGTGVAAPRERTAASGCGLNGPVKHVIYLQFDNTHFRRDRANVASDLEQMPHLLDFLQSNGTLFTNDHTILISHTAGGILSSLTGLYPDRQGQTVSNSYDFYKNNGLPTFTSSFKYWTAPVDGADDSTPNMITDTGKTTPAPWVPYTRAGCDFGGVGTANIELENNSTAPGGDIANVYSNPSPQASEPAGLRTTDFVGIAIHCAQSSSSVCAGSQAANARPDSLPDEPSGYTGYLALFGAKYVDPAITGGNACVSDTAGNPIEDSAGNCGFPGFDGMLAKNSLGYVAQMQEAGVPVTYAYISDAHDNHTLFRASGPGELDYVAQLKAYDDAFAAFFTRLQHDGIDKSNTLFVVTVDEGDHFAGGIGTPQADGSLAYAHTACPQTSTTAVTPCPANQIGEVNAKIGALLPAGEPGYDIHFDDAPTFYVNGQPAATDASVRQLERDVWNAKAPDPYAGSLVPIAQQLADPAAEKTLHMINTDPKRTPTFTLFGNPDFFFQTTNLSGGCAGSNVCVNPGFAWNHGDVQEEIGNTWAGIVGPGVDQQGLDAQTWTDHTNLRPTMLALAGLKDDYRDDGRVLVEAIQRSAMPKPLNQHRETVTELGQVYEQLNAPFGQFSQSMLDASTKALRSGSSADDTKYTRIEAAIAALTTQRDRLALQISSQLNGAAFDGQQLSEVQLRAEILEARALIAAAQVLAAASS